MSGSERTTPTAVIVGAGIGGLAAGLALRRVGWNIRIHERAGSPRELGFGVGLAPNALSALSELGVAEPVLRAAARMGGVEIRSVNGRLLRRLDGKSFFAVVALRPDLHGALLAAVGDDALRLGSEAVSFSEHDERVSVRFRDGSTDTGDLLIGADGIRSAIRKCLHPAEEDPRPSRFCAVRGVAYGVSHHLGDLSGVAYLDDALEAGTFRAGNDAVYWFMSLRSADVVEVSAADILHRRWDRFEPPLRAILSATPREEMRFDRLYERAPLATWGIGLATLLGDAAHPVLPHTAQGAAQALEDAVALGLALSGTRDVRRALRRYEDVRSRRTRAFIKLGPRIARVTTTKNAAIKAARSLALRLLPQRLLAMPAASLARDPHRELRG